MARTSDPMSSSRTRPSRRVCTSSIPAEISSAASSNHGSLAPFEPALFDRPYVRDLAGPHRVAQRFVPGPSVVAGGRQGVVDEHPHRGAGPALGRVLAAPAFLRLHTLAAAGLVDADAAVDGDHRGGGQGDGGHGPRA